MKTEDPSNTIREAIASLQDSYMSYLASLKRVLDLGEANIPSLVAALNSKYASPIAKALGLMAYAQAWEQAVPVLLDWLILQSPLYPDVLEALVRGGDKSLPLLKTRIVEFAANDDDEAVRNLFDLACRFSENALPEVVVIATELLRSPNADIREAATDALSRIALPHGRAAIPDLRRVALSDSVESVRNAAAKALLRVGETTYTGRP